MKKINLCIFLIIFSLNSFSQIIGSGVFDLDSNFYGSIIIGEQEWMSSNLKTSKYSNGENIEHIIDSATWKNTFSGAWSYFQNNQSNDSLYGKLYNFHSVIDDRNVCPEGWNVPTKMDWEIMADYLGGYQIAGGKLKMTGTELWISPNIDATNETGFSGYPSGSRLNNGGFPNSISSPYAVWWTATFNGNGQTWYADVHHGSTYLLYGLGSFRGGLPIRCLKSKDLSIQNNQKNYNIKVYPNPSEDLIKLDGILFTSSLHFRIVDTKGVGILEGNIVDETIDISNLEIGIYFIEITDENNRIGLSKIIKK